MKPETIVFDPSPCGFPKPRLPALPQGLACFSVVGTRNNLNHEKGNYREFSRGRYALFEAYRLSGVGAHTAILAPSYHCRTMIDPALALEAEVLLYPVSEQLSPDLAVIDRMCRQSRRPVRAILATHFFGIPQSLDDLARWSAERGIALIEDCSHAMFSREHRPHGIGGIGDFVVSSPYKFVASPDGGLLYSRTPEALSNCTPQQPSWRIEIGAALRTLRAYRVSRFKPPEPQEFEKELSTVVRAPLNPGRETNAPAGVSADFRPDQEGLASLRWSRLLHRHIDPDCVARERRRRYLQWAVATSGLTSCRPLSETLPEDCIPYMFPLVVNNPHRLFYWLKRLRVPIGRWDSIVWSNCPTANRYRLSLFHLPCHPAIDQAGMDWLTGTVRKLLSLDEESDTP